MSVTDYTTAYFDESRVDDDSPFPVVAGFCNTYDHWELFERKWKEASQHIPENQIKKYFRVRRSSPGDEKRYRDSLILADVMAQYTLWPIHVSIDKDFFKPLFSPKKIEPLMSSAYTVCSFCCCLLLDDLATNKLHQRWTPIKVVFDKGNANERWLDKGYVRYYSQNSETRLKKRPSFEDDDDLIPLKAADAYAWLLGRKYNHNEELEQLSIIHKKSNLYRKELIITRDIAEKYMQKKDTLCNRE